MVTSSKHGSKHSSKHGSKHAGFSRRLAPRCDYFTWFKVQFWLLIKLRNTEITSDIWEVFGMFRVSESCAVLRRRLATLSCNHPVSPFAGSCYFTDHRRNPLCVSGRRLRSLPLVSLSCRLSFLKYLFSRFSFFFPLASHLCLPHSQFFTQTVVKRKVFSFHPPTLLSQC